MGMAMGMTNRSLAKGVAYFKTLCNEIVLLKLLSNDFDQIFQILNNGNIKVFKLL